MTKVKSMKFSLRATL